MKKSVIFEYVNSSKKNFIIIFTIFVIGILIGVFCINNTKSSEMNKISEYINLIINNIKSDENINRFQCFSQSLMNNLRLIFIIWILGTTIVGSYFLYIVIIYKGFSVGYTISAIIASLGIKSGGIFVFSTLLFQNLVFLPSLFILSESGLKVYNRIKENNMNLRFEIIRHFIVMLIVLIFIFISSIIEAYVSTNTLIFFKNFI